MLRLVFYNTCIQTRVELVPHNVNNLYAKRQAAEVFTKNVMQQIVGFVKNGEIPWNNFYPQPIPLSLESVNDVNLVTHLYHRDYELRVAVDFSDNIHSKFILVDGKRVWLRSGKAANIPAFEPKHNPVSNLHYVRIFGAYIMAAISISRIKGFSDSGEFLEKLLVFYQETEAKLLALVDQLPTLESSEFDEAIKLAKTDLINILTESHPFSERYDTTNKHELAYNEVNKLLDKARNWVGLEAGTEMVATVMDFSESFDVSNFSDEELKKGLLGNTNEEINTNLKALKEKMEKYLNKGKFIVFDQPCVELTEAQRAQFKNEKYKEEAWFKQFDDDQKDLFELYIKRIAADRDNSTFVIPSQLRALFPALKNAYKQSIFCVDEESNIQELMSYFHCGTPAHVSNQALAATKRNRYDLVAVNVTQENLRQQQLNANVHLMVPVLLNSELPDKAFSFLQSCYRFFCVEPPKGVSARPDDSNTIAYVHEAARRANQPSGANQKGEEIFDTKVCLNAARRVESNNYNGMDKLVETVADNLNKLARMSDDDSSEIKRDRDAIQESIKEYNRLKSKNLLNDKDVIGTEIIYLITKIAYINNRLAEKYQREDLKTVGIFFGCASGENRTSVVEFSNMVRAHLDFLGIDIHHCLAKPLILYLARFKHHAYMKGGPGGDLGTVFAREKSDDSWPENFGEQAKKQIFWSQFSDRKAEPALSYKQQLLRRPIFNDPNDPLHLDMLRIATKTDSWLSQKQELNQTQEEFLLLHRRSLLSEIDSMRQLPNEERDKKVAAIERIVDESTDLLNSYIMRKKKISPNMEQNTQDSLIADQVIEVKSYENKIFRLSTSDKVKYAALMFAGGLLGGLIGCAIGMAVGTCVGYLPGTAVGGFIGAVKGAAFGFTLASAAFAVVGIGSGIATAYGCRPRFFDPAERTGVDLAKSLTLKPDEPRRLHLSSVKRV